MAQSSPAAITTIKKFAGAIVVVLAAYVLTNIVSGGGLPFHRLSSAPAGEPHDIEQLRALNHSEPLPQCLLPDVPIPAGIVPHGRDSAFAINLPEQLRNSLSVERIAHRQTGRPFLLDSGTLRPPDKECEATSRTAGTIWALYLSHRRDRAEALGDAVTTGGKRYHLFLFAPTAQRLDTLVSLVSAAVLSQ